mmetsp:Transcript_6334/g.13747  ORF Transcript_6334/g.13747 Transcript_6334/m.13747 type:complete len:478 (-) Transcript_6334:1547-2980(-)
MRPTSSPFRVENSPRGIRQPILVCFLCLISFLSGNLLHFLFHDHHDGNEKEGHRDNHHTIQDELFPGFWDPSAIHEPSFPLRSVVGGIKFDHNATAPSISLPSAVNTLRCFTTPGCYPGIRCAGGANPKKLSLRRKWEEHGFCTDDLLISNNDNKKDSQSTTGKHEQKTTQKEKSSKCLVYSFGLDKSSQWEESMANVFGCEVFAFDPTSSFPDVIAPNVRFYPFGLYQQREYDGNATFESNNNILAQSNHYDAIDPKKLRTLGEIVEHLGHEKQQIDLMKLDCEGCEYGVLKQLACHRGRRDVNHPNIHTKPVIKQLMVEFHFQKNLGMRSDQDILLAAEAIQCLEQDGWGIVSMEKRGCGEDDAEYIDEALKIIKEPMFVLFVTMRHLQPSEERESRELFSEVVKARTQVLTVQRKHLNSYGKMNQWPDEARNEWLSKVRVRKDAEENYNLLFRDRGIEFDDVDTFNVTKNNNVD